ncbi:DUF5330 domain-containing protein [Agrobacterium sp. ES01]|uniref:DUF5330 domain-containing protein n=1 Tax=Agrobacterium sp. ES01 TaxID=3420714 RepID=UPI003D0A7EAD
MWFLIKGTIWLTVVLVALSFFGNSPDTSSEPTPPFEVAGAVTAASGIYQYMTQICLEKPDVCEKGAKTIAALGHRAREGAYVAIGLIDTQLGEEDGVSTGAAKLETAVLGADDQPMPALVTGTITPSIPVPMQRPTR